MPYTVTLPDGSEHADVFKSLAAVAKFLIEQDADKFGKVKETTLSSKVSKAVSNNDGVLEGYTIKKTDAPASATKSSTKTTAVKKVIVVNENGTEETVANDEPTARSVVRTTLKDIYIFYTRNEKADRFEIVQTVKTEKSFESTLPKTKFEDNKESLQLNESLTEEELELYVKLLNVSVTDCKTSLSGKADAKYGNYVISRKLLNDDDLKPYFDM